MSDMAIHYSSKRRDWNTPRDLYDHLNRTFHFMLDACADHSNALAANYFTEELSCLTASWEGQRTFMNPPYGKAEQPCPANCKKKKCLPPSADNPKGRGHHITAYIPGIEDFVRKAYAEAQEGALVVCLLPARTDQAWYHDYCRKGDIVHLRGRLNFDDGDSGAPFPSMLVIFRCLEEINDGHD